MQKSLPNNKISNRTARARFTGGFWVTALVAVLFTACDKDQNDDLTPPEIHIVNTVPELTSAEICESLSDLVLNVEAGGALEITVRFTDDTELGSAKFDLHSNFDCHGHKNTIWNVIEIVELTGTEQTLAQTFQSPEDVRPGLYHLGIMALDAAGQEAVEKFFDLVIIDPADTVPPVIQMTTPAAGSTHSKSEPLLIEGIIADETSLATGGYEILFFEGNGIDLTVARVDFPDDFGEESEFSHSYTIPAFAQTGLCSLRVQAFDWRNNSTAYYRTIELTD